MSFWDYELNNNLSPLSFSTGSTYKAWWRCPVCNHVWQTTINHKFRGDKCPVCTGRTVVTGKNDLLHCDKTLAEEWDYSNNTETPDKVYFKSSKKYHWICPKGHHYIASLNKRVSGTGCPYCANKKVLIGFNDLKSQFPDIAADWDYINNKDLKPENVVYGSGKQVFWKCKNCGRSWKTSISNRTFSKTGCPDCSSKAAGKKFTANAVKENNFALNHPDLCKEWDYNKNYPTRPEDVPCGTNKQFYWICSKCGWSWLASPNTRSSGSGCPACSNKVVNPGVNDLQSLFPDIAKEWDYDKNGNITPDKVVFGSNKQFYWKCSKCGFEWKQSVYARTTGKGCKKCSRIKSAAGHIKTSASKNNFYTHYPEIAKEWHFEKNGEMKPSDFSSSSNKTVWWKCSFCGYEWKSSIASRTSSKSTCPNCNYVGTSFPQQAVFFYISKVFPDAKNRFVLGGMEFDIFIPSANTAIEYDGVFYHKNSIKKDNTKDNYCNSNSIKLFRIRDPSLPNTEYATIIPSKDGSQKALNNAIVQLLKYLGSYEKDFVSVERDQIQILSTYKKEFEENSLGKLFPDLIEEWDAESNGTITPFNVKPASNIKVSWKCRKCGNKWKAQIRDRTRADHPTGCPFCINQKISPGFNDLQTLYPEIASEWNTAKNDGLSPDHIAPGSNKKVSWICSKCGGEWIAAPNTRTGQKCGCPYCSGKKIKIGYNDLATTEPELSKEWNYERNNDLTPQKITRGSNKKVWWKCASGHEWQSTIHNRISGRNCPICYKEKVEREKTIEGQLTFYETEYQNK